MSSWSTATETTSAATGTFRDALLAERLRGARLRHPGARPQRTDARGVQRASEFTDELESLRGVSARAGRATSRSSSSPTATAALITVSWLRPGAGSWRAARPPGPGARQPPTSRWPSRRRPGRPRRAVLLSRLVPSLPIPTGLSVEDAEPGPGVAARHRRGPALRPHGARRAGSLSTPSAQREVLRRRRRSSGFQCCWCFRARTGIASAAVSRRWFETLTTADKRFREWPSMRHETLQRGRQGGGVRRNLSLDLRASLAYGFRRQG